METKQELKFEKCYGDGEIKKISYIISPFVLNTHIKGKHLTKETSDKRQQVKIGPITDVNIGVPLWCHI